MVGSPKCKSSKVEKDLSIACLVWNNDFETVVKATFSHYGDLKDSSPTLTY